jgi:hypothetical protein
MVQKTNSEVECGHNLATPITLIREAAATSFFDALPCWFGGCAINSPQHVRGCLAFGVVRIAQQTSTCAQSN